MKLYRPLKEDQKVFIKNFYVYESKDEKQVAALVSIAKVKDKMFFIDFNNIEVNSDDWNKYLEYGCQNWHDDQVSWYWTKQLLDFLDSLVLDKPLKVISIDDLDEVFKYKAGKDAKEVNIFEMDKKKFKDSQIGLVTELLNEDYMELTMKLTKMNEKQNVFSKELAKDITDSSNWMVETLYDNN